MVWVRTATGRRQKYDPGKIYHTSLRAGATRELANEVVEDVSRRVYDGIPTRKILKMVLDSLRRRQAEHLASRYDLKSAILRMGPAGFAFETYLCNVLSHHGYDTRLRQEVQGRCARHEIDIILEKDGRRSMVEVKYHNAPGIYTGLKEALYTFARFEDLEEGHELGKCERFDEAWLATNTRSSLDARRYASCKGLRLLGWKYPPRRGLERMIEEKGLYPITVLHGLDSDSFNALNRANLLLVADLARSGPEQLADAAGIDMAAAETLVEQSRRIASGS